MKEFRILVLQDNEEGNKKLQFTVPGRTVEFEYHSSADRSSWEPLVSSSSAVAVPIGSATPDLVNAISAVQGWNGVVFLHGGETPLHAMARWIFWETTEREGLKGPGESQLLSENLEYFSVASLYQQCLQMMSSPDEEHLLSQIADTFASELSAGSCVLWLTDAGEPDEMVIASARGSIGIDAEGSRFYLSQSGMAESVWRGVPFQAETDSHLYVPLMRQERVIGLAKLGERKDRKPYSQRDLQSAQIIADYAASALNTVSRLGMIDKVPLRDPETGIHTAAFLCDYFEKERNKAARFRRPLSVLFLKFENWSFLLEQTRESVASGVLVSVVENMLKALRDSDLMVRQDANSFCIVLPETDAYGALLVVRRLRRAIREKSRFQFLGTEFSLQPLFMYATYPKDGRAFSDLLHIAEERQARRQKSPLQRLRIAEYAFWDAFDIMVGKEEHYELLRKGEDVSYFQKIRRDLGRNGYFSMTRGDYLRIIESIAQDSSVCGTDRGIVIVAGTTPEVYRQVFLSFRQDTSANRNVYIVGHGGNTRFDAKSLLYISAEDDLLKDREVILYLKGSVAYGLLGIDRGNEVEGFNTADEWLVESMIEKFQEMYLLQRTF